LARTREVIAGWPLPAGLPARNSAFTVARVLASKAALAAAKFSR
jgi:hypothetical protein